MKSFAWLTTSLILLSAALALSSGCNPNLPSGHQGSPPANNAVNPAPLISPAPRVIGNIRPNKYGTPYLLKYARHQAGTERPGSETQIEPDQLSFGKAAGRN